MNVFKRWDDIPDDFEGQCYIEKSQDEYWLIKKRISHREDGPAIIYSHGTQVWYQNNLIHRLDGPVMIFAKNSDRNVFYIHNVSYNEEKFWNHPLVIEHKLNKILEL